MMSASNTEQYRQTNKQLIANARPSIFVFQRKDCLKDADNSKSNVVLLSVFSAIHLYFEYFYEIQCTFLYIRAYLNICFDISPPPPQKKKKKKQIGS